MSHSRNSGELSEKDLEQVAGGGSMLVQKKAAKGDVESQEPTLNPGPGEKKLPL